MSIAIPHAMLRELQRLPNWTEDVVRILHGPGVGSVWVRVGQFTITPKPIRAIGDAIKKGTIKVYYDPKMLMAIKPSAAYYDGGYDAMFTSFVDTSTIGRKAVLVHEAVHAINDMKKRASILHVDDEAAAYTAQMMYIRGTGVRAPIRLTSTTTVVDDIYRTAFAVADAIFAGTGHPTTELEALRTAIRAHPDYTSSANATVGYNGI